MMGEMDMGNNGMKKTLHRVLVLCMFLVTFLMAGAFSAWAGNAAETDGVSDQRVYDMAELLDEDTIEELESRISELRKSLGFDIVIVTRQELSLSGESDDRGAQAYADDWFDEGGFGVGNDRDGILFLIDMENRELVLSTSGKAIRIFTDERIEKMLDHIYEGASDGDFEASAASFLKDTEYYGKKGIPVGQYNYDTETGKVSVYKSIRWYEALLAVGISLIVAGTACLNVKRKYAMEDDPKKLHSLNMAYRAESHFAYNSQNDQLINKFVTSRVIQSSSGGSSSSHRSSGRSSTHRSSSGRSHGGGSRRF